ncbi:MAG TPA: ribonuclease Z [Chloroflexota bacterium]|nr:ribonuclease Z [Chloroflexota bacterium]
MLDVCLLGSGGMQPLPGRRLSAVLVRAGSSQILIDCGEGTQVAIRERGWGLGALDTILLTHMHADHVLGLPGLLLTLANAQRDPEAPLTIFGPEPLLAVLQGLLVVAPRLPFPVVAKVLAGGEQFSLPGYPGLTGACVALTHDIPCLAYAIELPRAPRFDADRARALGIPVGSWRTLQRGDSVVVEGRAITADQVLGAPRRGLRLVLATDTSPTPDLTEFVRHAGRGTDLLIADAMYANADDKPTRWEAQHLTFAEAATLARAGLARRLWLTHFGPALVHPHDYLDNAAEIFPAAAVGEDGMTTTLTFTDDSNSPDPPTVVGGSPPGQLLLPFE